MKKLGESVGTLGILALFLGLFVTPLHAAGTSAAEFLKLGAGARAAALGDAFSAVADDVTAAYWNPAGLKQIETPQLSVMENSWLVNTHYQFLGAALPVKKWAFGVSLYRLDFGTLDRYTAADAKDGTFGATSLATSFTFARQLCEDILLGASVKYLRETLESESASSVAGDVGVLFKRNHLQLAGTLQHVGPGLKFVQKSEPLPITLRVGAAATFLDEKLQMSLDLSKPRDNDLSFHGGSEYKLTQRVTLRAGTQFTPGNEIDINGLTNITGGLGIHVGRFTIDYAFVPFGSLGSTHRVSLLIPFHRS